MGPFALTLTTPPTSEPVTVAEAKARLRVTVAAEDGDVAALVQQARELAEAACQRAFVTQTYTLRLDDFPRGDDRAIYLPRPPLRSVASVRYYDADGVQQTLDPAGYWVASGGEPGRVLPFDGAAWPTVQAGRPEAVEVVFVAGYGAASAVPYAAKAAILVIAAALRENPAGATLPDAARKFLDTLETGTVR